MAEPVTQSQISDLPILRVKQASHSFGSTRILHDISFTLKAGEICALIGPNGAGKSTLLSILAGDISPTYGSAEIFDPHSSSWVNIYRCKPKPLAKLRAVLLQDSKVAFSYTVDEVVKMGRSVWRGTAQSVLDDEIVTASLQHTQMFELKHRNVLTLSGGENGRTQLARVLAQDTKILFLDEPTAAMDIKHQETTLLTVQALANAGKAVLVVLHDISLAVAYADRILLLDSGKLVADGSPAKVCTSELLSSVYGWEIDVFKHPQNGTLIVLPNRN